MNPSWRGRTLKVSMALAALGLVIFRSASSSWGARAMSDRLLPPLAEETLELLRGGLHVGQVRVGREGALEVVEGGLEFSEPEVVQAEAGEGAEVNGVALDDLLAVRERSGVVAGEVVERGALVPPLGELRLLLDDLAERLDGSGYVAPVHLVHAALEEGVHLRVSRAAPDPPERVLGQPADDRVGIAERLDEKRHVGHGAGLAEPGRALPARLDVALAERFERLLARERSSGEGGEGHEEEQGAGGEGLHRFPTSFRNSASSSVATPRRLASSSL